MKFILLLLYILYSSAADDNYNATPISTQRDRDILSSHVDSNDKIEKKIINAISEFSSKCNNYKQMNLSLNGFTFPKKSVVVDLRKQNVSFYNFTFAEESDLAVERKPYSTLAGCDSSKTFKVEATLPTNIKIFANVKVTENVNSSNAPEWESINEGLISITLKNISVSKEFTIHANNSKNEHNITRTISYFRTEVLLEMNIKYQKLIYISLNRFLNEIESPLKHFLVNKLSAKLGENGVSVNQSCSKFVNTDAKSEINLPLSKNEFNNTYVISKLPFETRKAGGFSTGTIIIQGLSRFDSIEMIVSGNELPSPKSEANQHNTSSPRYDDTAENETTTIQIKIKSLEGKLNRNYNSKQTSFSFSIDFILFEIQKSKSLERNTYYSNCHNGSNPHTNELNVNLSMGNVQIKFTNLNMDENEKGFANVIFSEYLNQVLNDTLIGSLTKKLQNNTSVMNC